MEDRKGAQSQSMVSGFMLCRGKSFLPMCWHPTLTYFPFWAQGPAAESQHLTQTCFLPSFDIKDQIL